MVNDHGKTIPAVIDDRQKHFTIQKFWYVAKEGMAMIFPYALDVGFESFTRNLVRPYHP